jgi:alcohol dehydrogenase/L-iditol 2-dehydrogenase
LLSDQLKHWATERDGLGCEGVVDAAGVSATLKTAIDVVRPAGWISKVGWGRDPLGFSIDPLVQKNFTLQGSFSHTWAIWERVLLLLANGSLDVSKIVGGSWSLDHWHEAFERQRRCTRGRPQDGGENPNSISVWRISLGENQEQKR